MSVREQMIADMRYLRQRYGWTDEDADEIRAALRSCGASLARYFATLAAAHRAGYEQTAENGFVRLHAWCAQQGLPDPYQLNAGEWFQAVAALALKTREGKR
ncbi:MAG: hypothetical protein JWR22_1307 [Herminiimonas sp.]|nr:hypothetical protein [Herminiimonas sp.]